VTLYLHAPNPLGLIFIFYAQLGLFPYSLAQIGHCLGYFGHLKGDLIPKRGHIFVGSWDSSSEPNKLYKLGLLSLRGYFFYADILRSSVCNLPISHVLRGIKSCFERRLSRHVCI
jgi:hypothetical protein